MGCRPPLPAASLLSPAGNNSFWLVRKLPPQLGVVVRRRPNWPWPTPMKASAHRWPPLLAPAPLALDMRAKSPAHLSAGRVVPAEQLKRPRGPRLVPVSRPPASWLGNLRPADKLRACISPHLFRHRWYYTRDVLVLKKGGSLSPVRRLLACLPASGGRGLKLDETSARRQDGRASSRLTGEPAGHGGRPVVSLLSASVSATTICHANACSRPPAPPGEVNTRTGRRHEKLPFSSGAGTNNNHLFEGLVVIESARDKICASLKGLPAGRVRRRRRRSSALTMVRWLAAAAVA
jgi:hypothetical protein